MANNPPFFAQAGGVYQVSTEGLQNNYSVAGAVVPVAAATDVVTLTNPAAGTKTLYVRHVGVTGTSGTQVDEPVSLVVRSTVNTGGTSTTPAIVPHDSIMPAATGVVNAYTTLPGTVGTLVGVIRQKIASFLATTAAEGAVIEWNFADKNDKSIVLRPGQVLAINLNGGTVTTGSLNYELEWVEV